MQHNTALNLDLPVTVIDSRDAPLMLHEEIATGDCNDQDFRVIRDPHGLRWQVQAGDSTATFSLFDLLKTVVHEITKPELAEQEA